MKKIASVSSLLKKVYRLYTSNLIEKLQNKGFTDLRISFLEVLLHVCENDGPSIKSIGQSCGLKKQTMTSHLNELVKRGYITREVNTLDKREQKIFLTNYGEKFKITLFECISEIQDHYMDILGETEIERIEYQLNLMHDRISDHRSITRKDDTQLSFNDFSQDFL